MPRIPALASLLCLLGPMAAQAPTLDPAQIAIGAGAGLQRDGDGWLGCGADYKVAFANGRMVYTPALGHIAPHDLPFALEVTHVGRGALQTVGPATTVAGELRVDFVRPELREELWVRADGVKQDFVFDRLPVGAGDLVVRARVTSELRPERATSPGALRFSLGGYGGIEVGQVVGIDAAGARATGSLRSDGTSLEFVLPEAFVANARLPLTVDPLLATTTVTGATGDDRRPEVCALPAPANTYLVVWGRVFSATNDDVRGQRVSATGALLGSLLQLESSATSADDLAIAANTQNGKWFVCWEQGDDIVGRFVTAAGALGTAITVAGGANLQITPDLAGGRLGGTLGNGDDVLCAWHDSTSNTLRGARVDAVAETAGGEHVLVSGSAFVTVGQPALSPDNPASRVLMTYVSTSSALGTRAVRGVLTDTALTVVGSSFAIAGSALIDAVDPSCAGNGIRFVVACTTSGVLGGGISCVPIELFASQTVVGTARAIAGPNGAGSNASVGWFDSSVFVAFSSVGAGGGTNRDVSVVSLDPFTCTTCEGLLPIDLGSVDADVAIAARLGNAPASEQGAVVYVPLSAATGDIRMRLLSAADGVFTTLAGGCANGQLLAPCAVAGNANFAVQMRNAPANQLTFAAHSTASFGLGGLACGTCVILPDTGVGIVQTVGVSTADGSITVPLPLPGGASVIGINLFSQCFFLGTECLNLFRLTEGIRTTIE